MDPKRYPRTNDHEFLNGAYDAFMKGISPEDINKDNMRMGRSYIKVEHHAPGSIESPDIHTGVFIAYDHNEQVRRVWLYNPEDRQNMNLFGENN